MSRKDKDFYVWTMAECIKDTYEWWGIDMMSMYDHIKKDFPNATKAIKKMYSNFKAPKFYEAQYLFFEKPQYVYEAIASFIPLYEQLRFDIRTRELSKEYKNLNMCSWNRFVSIKRIDLLMAAILFAEEFILQPVSCKNVILTDSKITIYGNFVTLKVSKHEDLTYISIRVKNVVLLEYLVQN